MITPPPFHFCHADVPGPLLSVCDAQDGPNASMVEGVVFPVVLPERDLAFSAIQQSRKYAGLIDLPLGLQLKVEKTALQKAPKAQDACAVLFSTSASILPEAATTDPRYGNSSTEVISPLLTGIGVATLSAASLPATI